MEPSGPDVLHRVVRLHGDLGDLFERVRGEIDANAVGAHQLGVLAGERVPRLGENTHELVLAEVAQLDADGEAALQLGHEVRRLRAVERAGRHEKDVVGTHDPVAREHRGALDDGQEVALHALARDVGPAAVLLGRGRDLVDLVEEDDAGLFGALDRLAPDFLAVAHRLRGLLGQHLARLADLELARDLLRRHEPFEHVLEVNAHLLDALARYYLDGRDGLLLRGDLDLAFVQFARAELRPDLLLRPLVRFQPAGMFRGVHDAVQLDRGQERLEYLVLGLLACLLDHLAALLEHDHIVRRLHQVADDRLDVAAVVADLGVPRRLDLDEGRVDKPGEPARDLGLADAGRAYHDDVLRDNVLADLGRKLLAAPAVAHGDRDGPLRLVLPDDVPVELGDDAARGQVFHGTSST